MFRIKFLTGSAAEFLERSEVQLIADREDMVRYAGVCDRTFRDWKRGKHLMPFGLYEALNSVIFGYETKVEIVDEDAHKREAGRKGGFIRGNAPGNIENLQRARERLREKRTDPLWESNHVAWRKTIKMPERSVELAEFIGALLGDGHVDRYQVKFCSDRNEMQYTKFLQSLSWRLFDVMPTIEVRSNVNNVVISRRDLVEFLNSQGLPSGDKVRHQVGVPSWISDDEACMIACLRGLMDTDGCFYVDKHSYRDKLYFHPGLNFTNYSFPLAAFVRDTFLDLGFSPTQNYSHHVVLRRTQEVHEYFRVVGTSNEKHRIKYENYCKISQKKEEWPSG